LVVADAASSAVCAGNQRAAYKSDAVKPRPPFVVREGAKKLSLVAKENFWYDEISLLFFSNA